MFFLDIHSDHQKKQKVIPPIVYHPDQEVSQHNQSHFKDRHKVFFCLEINPISLFDFAI